MGIPLVVYEFSGRVGDVLACLYYARLLEKSTSLTVPKAAAAARSPAEAADYFGGEAVPGVEPTWNRSWSDDNVIAEALRLRSFPTPANPFLIQAWFVLCREHANESGRGRKPFNLQKKWKEVMYIYRIATIRVCGVQLHLGWRVEFSHCYRCSVSSILLPSGLICFLRPPCPRCSWLLSQTPLVQATCTCTRSSFPLHFPALPKPSAPWHRECPLPKAPCVQPM